MLITDIPKEQAEGLVSPDALRREWYCNEVANHVQALAYHHMLREYRQPINDPKYSLPSE